jgi:integrase
MILRDLECRGLALVVNPTGMTWSYSYRPRGLDLATGKRPPNRSVTIGNPSTHTPDEARIAANRVKGAAASGADPAAERKAKQQAMRRQRANTLDRLVDEYAQALPRRPKLSGTGLPSPAHVGEELAQVRAAVLGLEAEDRPVSSVTAAEVRRMIGSLAGRPATARARFGALSRFFDWCQDEEHIEANPCAMVARSRRPKAVAARAHFLTLPELAHLWTAAEALAPVYRDLARFLIAVPCRRGEGARLDWSHLNLSGAVWTMPGAMTKNGDPHRLHLPDLVLSLLRQRHANARKPCAGLVFPAPQSGAVIDTFSVVKADLQAAADITGWRWHDFRRSFATALGEAGIAEPVADAVLNHRQSATRGGVLGVYQRAQRWPEQVKAMQAWNDALAVALDPSAAGKPASATVVTLHPHAA